MTPPGRNPPEPTTQAKTPTHIYLVLLIYRHSTLSRDVYGQVIRTEAPLSPRSIVTSNRNKNGTYQSGYLYQGRGRRKIVTIKQTYNLHVKYRFAHSPLSLSVLTAIFQVNLD